MQEFLKNPFLLSAGGLGDLLVSLACVDKDYQKIDVVFFADNPELIKQAKFLPIINQLLVFDKAKSLHKWNDFLKLDTCVSTGITPKNFDYSEWKNCDNVFEKYGVSEFPMFLGKIEPALMENHPSSGPLGFNMASIMLESKNSNESKKKIILEKNIPIIEQELNHKYFINILGDSIPNYKIPNKWQPKFGSLEAQIKIIKGSQIVYSVDSWVKTVSAMSKIPTIVYDNVYSNNYEENMGGQDWGHNIFLNNWSMIELRKQ